ncbi:uncharacterized protein MELLADRAFT_26220, partial [Melampsora larici-populina 98AG31]
GDGGDGGVSFHREKFVARGGPSGGNGGKGGSIYLRPSEHVHSLNRIPKILNAPIGSHGAGQWMNGKSGEDLILDVPIGTVVKEIRDQVDDVQDSPGTFLLAKGGEGGMGNSNFIGNQTVLPRFATKGKKGEVYKLELELKTLADVGLVGFPNSGKSTLIHTLTNSRSEIAPYEFTTLHPQIGTLIIYTDGTWDTGDQSHCPGLLPKASMNVGLGHAFLRHIERSRILVVVVDILAELDKPCRDVEMLMKELEEYQSGLSGRVMIVVANKADLSTSSTQLEQ